MCPDTGKQRTAAVLPKVKQNPNSTTITRSKKRKERWHFLSIFTIPPCNQSLLHVHANYRARESSAARGPARHCQRKPGWKHMFWDPHEYRASEWTIKKSDLMRWLRVRSAWLGGVFREIWRPVELMLTRAKEAVINMVVPCSILLALFNKDVLRFGASVQLT